MTGPGARSRRVAEARYLALMDRLAHGLVLAMMAGPKGIDLWEAEARRLFRGIGMPPADIEPMVAYLLSLGVGAVVAARDDEPEAPLGRVN